MFDSSHCCTIYKSQETGQIISHLCPSVCNYKVELLKEDKGFRKNEKAAGIVEHNLR